MRAVWTRAPKSTSMAVRGATLLIRQHLSLESPDMINATSLIRTCLLFSFLATACGSDSDDANTEGTGGALSTGGAGSGGGPAGSGGTATGSGGTPGSGGDTSSGGAPGSGGVTSSGGAGTGGAGTGGAGASDDGGTLSPDGGSPDGAAPPAPCRTNADCASVDGKPLCEAATGDCIACHTNAQCSNTEECTNNVCTKLPECENSLGCASAPGDKSICDDIAGVCVQCTTDDDCGDGKVCRDRVCHVSCNSDNDCTAQNMLCNQGILFGGQCTQCIVSSDCNSGEYCESGTCVPQTCKPAQQSCNGNLVVQCNEAGSGVIPLTQCTLALLSYCIVDGDNAKCVGGCENGKQDGLETDVDCGGPLCERCAAGKACVLPTDCSSNDCESSICQ